MLDRLSREEKKDLLGKLEPAVRKAINLLRDRGQYNFEELGKMTGVARTHISSFASGKAPLREAYLAAFLAHRIIEVGDLMSVGELSARQKSALGAYLILKNARVLEMLGTLEDRGEDPERVLEGYFIAKNIPLPEQES